MKLESVLPGIKIVINVGKEGILGAVVETERSILSPEKQGKLSGYILYRLNYGFQKEEF